MWLMVMEFIVLGLEDSFEIGLVYKTKAIYNIMGPQDIAWL